MSTVSFYHLKSNHSQKTEIIIISQTEFHNCLHTFKSHPDYQSSSNSIYLCKCLSSSTKDWSKVSNLDYIPRPIDSSTQLISIGPSLQHNLLNNSFSIEMICSQMRALSQKSSSSNIIVSVCCGTAATEINSSETCLCLDIDRRSLFSACINMYQKKTKSILLSFFDYSKGLYLLLSELKKTCNKDIIVL